MPVRVVALALLFVVACARQEAPQTDSESERLSRDDFVSATVGTRAHGRGTVCATDLIRRERVAPDTVRDYVWALCERVYADTGASGAPPVSGSSLPVAVTIHIPPGAFTPVSAEAPRDASAADDRRRLFPEAVRRSPHFTDVRFQNERLRVLRSRRELNLARLARDSTAQ